jgi:hypothetical protein
MNTFLYVIKYCAAIVSGAYGIYATVNDFHEHKHGKKVLTRKGRAGIVFLVFSTILSLSSDTIRDAREHKKSKEDAAKRDETLIEARRASSPFNMDRMEGGIQALLPISSRLVESYLRRAEHFRGPSDTATYTPQQSKGFPQLNNPNENSLARFATNMVANVYVYKNQQEPQSAQDPESEKSPDLSLMLVCKKVKKGQHVSVDTNIWWGNPFDGSKNRDAYRFTIECETDNILVAYHRGTMLSFADFAGATVHVSLQDSFGTKVEAVPLTVGLKTNNGRELQFVNFSYSKTCTENCFTTTMPSDFK